MNINSRNLTFCSLLFRRDQQESSRRDEETCLDGARRADCRMQMSGWWGYNTSAADHLGNTCTTSTWPWWSINRPTHLCCCSMGHQTSTGNFRWLPPSSQNEGEIRTVVQASGTSILKARVYRGIDSDDPVYILRRRTCFCVSRGGHPRLEARWCCVPSLQINEVKWRRA